MDNIPPSESQNDTYHHDIKRHSSGPIFNTKQHARSASKSKATPSLNIRSRPTIQGYDSAAERIPYSYDSSESFSSSFTEPLSIGSFTSDQPSYSISIQPTRNKHQAINPFELTVVSMDSSSSRRWSHMYPKVTGIIIM